MFIRPWIVSASGIMAVTLWFSVCSIKPTLGTRVPMRTWPPRGSLSHLPALLGMPQLPWGVPKQHMMCVQAPGSLLKCQPPSEISPCKNSPHFPSGIRLHWVLQEYAYTGLERNALNERSGYELKIKEMWLLQKPTESRQMLRWIKEEALAERCHICFHNILFREIKPKTICSLKRATFNLPRAKCFDLGFSGCARCN